MSVRSTNRNSWSTPRLRAAIAPLCATLLLGAAGCGDEDGGPSGGIAGTYTLTRAGGQALPATVQLDGFPHVYQSGQFVLTEGRAYTLQLRHDNLTQVGSGLFQRVGDLVQFTDPKNQDDYTAKLSDNDRTLTLYNGPGADLEFRR